MKKWLLIVSAFLFCIPGFSQGIHFEKGTWKEVLEKAKETNKPIFVDIYTSWCVPCKKMSKDIFPLEEVGRVYNTNYICYQIDAEKGEGVEIARNYFVQVYPTYLFIKANGELFYRETKLMTAENFLELSSAALTESIDPKPIAIWDKEHAEKKADPAFLLEYMEKRSKLGLPNNDLFDEYLQAIPQKERTSDAVTTLYKTEMFKIKVNSFAFENLQKNKDKFVIKPFTYVYKLIFSSIKISTSEAAETKNKPLLKAAMSAYDQLPNKKALELSKDELYMQYYKKTGEKKNYQKTLIHFGNKNLMALSKDTLLKKDMKIFQFFEVAKDLISEYLDSTSFVEVKTNMEHYYSNKTSGELNDIAWWVFKNVKNKKTLKNALKWSDRSLELNPDKDIMLDTNANLLYKLGRKEEAIAQEEKVLRVTNKDNNFFYNGFVETLRKMKAGEE